MDENLDSSTALLESVEQISEEGSHATPRSVENDGAVEQQGRTHAPPQQPKRVQILRAVDSVKGMKTSSTSGEKFVKFAPRQVYWMRLHVQAHHLPGSIARRGTFIAVTMHTQELGGKLTSRQVVTDVSKDRNPQWVDQDRPLCFMLGESVEAPASSCELMVDVYSAEEPVSLLPCRPPAEPPGAAVLIAKVRILMKDVLDGHKLVKRFVSPMVVSRRNKQKTIGELEAEITLSGPRNGRCLLGITQDHKIFDHARELCFLVDSLDDTASRRPDGSLQEGFTIRSVMRSRQIAYQRSVGPIEARCIHGEHGATIQTRDEVTGAFLDWVTVKHAESMSGTQSSKRLQVTGIRETEMELMPLQALDGTVRPYMWAPASLSDFPQKALTQRQVSGDVMPTSDRAAMSFDPYINQWALTCGDANQSKYSKALSNIERSSNKVILQSQFLDSDTEEDIEWPQTDFPPQPDPNGATIQPYQNDQPTSIESHSPSQMASQSNPLVRVGRRMSETLSDAGEALKILRKPSNQLPPPAKTAPALPRGLSLANAQARIALAKQVHWTVQDIKAMPFVEPTIPEGKNLVAELFHAQLGDDGLLEPVWNGKVKHDIDSTPTGFQSRRPTTQSEYGYEEGFNSQFTRDVTVSSVIEFDYEQQKLAPALLALAVEMQRLSSLAEASMQEHQ